MPPVSEENRKSELEFWQAFETVRPQILGALLDVIIVAVRNLPNVKLAELPRMADFLLWITAAEEGLGWKPGTFQRAYRLNRTTANDIVIEASMVALAIRRLLEKQEAWEGTATELKDQLEQDPSEEDRKKRAARKMRWCFPIRSGVLRQKIRKQTKSGVFPFLLPCVKCWKRSGKINGKGRW